MASECARADVAERRKVWIGERQPAMRREPHRLVFIDETSVNTKMVRSRGRARHGKWLKALLDVSERRTGRSSVTSRGAAMMVRCARSCANWRISVGDLAAAVCISFCGATAS